MEVIELISYLEKCNIIKRIDDNCVILTRLGSLVTKPPTIDYNDVCIVPQYNEITSRSQVDLSTNITRNYKIPTPLIASNMECLTNSDFIIKLWKHNVAGAMHRFYKDQNTLLEELKKIAKFDVLPIVSCGIQEDQINLMIQCMKLGAKIIIVDLAHGHSKMMLDMLKKLRKYIDSNHLGVDIIAGNFCTPEALEYLVDYIDGGKVGIASGSICQTAVRAGAGGGMISSLSECYEVAKKHDIPLICDGGISAAGDVVKALVAGANSCMCGKLFGRCPESAAETIERNGQFFKIFYGMASNHLKQKIYGEKKKHVASEGVVVELPIGLPVDEFVPEFLAAIRSGYTYCGASNIKELHEKGEIRQITHAAYERGKPHAVTCKNARKVSN